MKRFLMSLILSFIIAVSGYCQASGGGDVSGPSSATDNAVVRFDGTTGALIQTSGVILSDSNTMYGLTGLIVSGTATVNNLIGSVTGNASTATALAANPNDCGAGTVATAIDASGNLTCSITPLISGGTLTSGYHCRYDGTGIDCDRVEDASGDCASNAVCMGGHTHSSYLTAESDPVFISASAYAIDATSLDNISNAITSESDPIFIASDSYVIDTTSFDTWDAGDISGVYDCSSGDCNTLTMAAGESFTQGSGTLTLGGSGTVEFTSGNIELTNNQVFLGNGTGTINLTSFKRAATVFDPVAGDLVDFGKEPQALWVTGIYGTCITASATVTFLEADANSANAVTIDAEFITNATEASDLTIYNPSIDSGDHIQVRVGTVNGATGTLTLTATGYIKP